jgi:hypothetical protein
MQNVWARRNSQYGVRGRGNVQGRINRRITQAFNMIQARCSQGPDEAQLLSRPASRGVVAHAALDWSNALAGQIGPPAADSLAWVSSKLEANSTKVPS